MLACSLTFLSSLILAQQPKPKSGKPEPKPSSKEVVTTITISEPATVSLRELYVKADLVALVQIRSGDTEHYTSTLYRATVLEGFKGIKKEEVIYFSPYNGYGIGSEYLVFLRKADGKVGDLIEKQSESTLPYDPVQKYYQVMYDGYSAMPVDYTCALPECGYGIKVAYEQVLLPKNLKMIAIECKDGASWKSWVRKEDIVRLLSKGMKE